jgi:hypothetical protein
MVVEALYQPQLLRKRRPKYPLPDKKGRPEGHPLPSPLRMGRTPEGVAAASPSKAGPKDVSIVSVLSNRYNVPVVSQWSQRLNAVNYLMMREPEPTRKGGPKAALSLARSTILRRAVAADQGPPVQPNKASSTDERIPDLRAIVAATTLQSLARESLLASLARRQASAWPYRQNRK